MLVTPARPSRLSRDWGVMMMTFCYVVDDTRKQGARFQALLNGREQSDNLLLRSDDPDRDQRSGELDSGSSGDDVV